MVTSWLRVRFPPLLSSSKAKEREKICGSFFGSDLSCLQNWHWNCSTHLHISRSSLLLLYIIWKNCGELHGEHHTYTSASGFLSAAAAKKKAPPPVQQQHYIFFASGQASGWSDIEKIKISHYKSQKMYIQQSSVETSQKKKKNAVLQNEWPKTEQFCSLTKCARAHTYPSPWA